MSQIKGHPYGIFLSAFQFNIPSFIYYYLGGVQ